MDSRLKPVLNVMESKFNGLLNLDSIVPSSTYYINNDNNTTWRKYILFNLRHTFGLMSNNDVKYLPWFCKIAWGDEVKFDIVDDNADKVNKLITIIELIKCDKIPFDKVKEIKSYSELIDFCKSYLNRYDNEEKVIINNKTFVKNNEYEIRVIDTYEEANEIGKYSADETDAHILCFTNHDSSWASFTANGNNKVYCCLIDGWKDIKPEPKENAPYDEYGLSMIWVFIDSDGNIAFSNTRWNHLNAGDSSIDHSFTKEQLSEILGVNFYEVFKPYTKEELHAKGVVLLDEVQDLLDSGKKPEEFLEITERLDNGYLVVKLNNKYNMIDNNNKLVF